MLTLRRTGFAPLVLAFTITTWLGFGPCVTAGAFAQVAADRAPIDASTPAATVESLHAAIIAAMQKPGVAAYPDRLALLDPVVRALFDFPTIARLVLGSRWSDAAPADRDRFIDTFSRYSVANYAAEFDSFSGHAFKTDSVTTPRDRVAVVRSTLTTGAGETHRFDYQLREQGGRWLVVGVAVDGVNDIALKRSQYDAVIKKDGFEALLKSLETKIRGFARGEKEDD